MSDNIDIELSEMIKDTIAMVKKLKENGEEPKFLRINSALLKPPLRDAFLAESERLGLKVIFL